MCYSRHFKHTDDIINHLNGVIPTINDHFLKAKYVGFVSVSGVAVYETALKDIFITFAQNKNKIFGNFIENYFNRINGKIKIQVIQDEYIGKFGNKYQERFKKKLNKVENQYLKTYKRDIRSSYSNLILWRNDFAHESKLNSTATYDEVVQAYQDGKEIIHCLAATMKR